MPEIVINKKQEKELLLKTLFSSPFATIIASVLTTFIIATIFLKVGGPVPISVQQTTQTTTSAFVVEGEGKVKAIPDEAVITFGINIQESSVIAAKTKVEKAIAGFNNQLKALGIPKDNIQTTLYSISPRYSFTEGKSIPDGYNASIQQEVKFKNFNLIEKALEKATENGINIIGNIRLQLSEQTRHEAEQKARNQAVEEAKEKAKTIAKAAGVSLGKIISIEEAKTTPPLYGTLPAEANIPSSEAIQPGSTNVTIKIKLEYEIR